MALAVTFAWPSGFWLGLAAAGVLLSHLIRRRARRHVVPFLPLWTAALAQARGGFGTRLMRLMDLFLVVLACAAIAVAAARPYVPGRKSTARDLVLVLDGGVSLRADQRQERMRKVGVAEIVRRVPGTRLVVIAVTDNGATVWSGDDTAGALAAILAHEPGWTDASPNQALALGRVAAAGLRDPDLVFVSHRPGRPDGYRLRTVRIPVRNAGFAGLELVEDPEGGGTIVRAQLRGQGKVAVEGLWEGEVAGRRTVNLKVEETGEVTLRLHAAGDGFAPDDIAYLQLPERSTPRVLVVSEKEPSPFLIAALQALERTGLVQGPLDKTTPRHAAQGASRYDVLVFDRCAPPELDRGMRALYLAPPPGRLPFRLGELAAAPALFDVAKRHPVLKGFDFERVIPRRARTVLGGEAIARAAQGPVLAVAPGWIALGFDPDRCILAASPAYPLFLRNCIQHLSAASPREQPEYFRVGETSPARGLFRIGTHGIRMGARLLGPPGFWRRGDEAYAVNFLEPELDLREPGVGSDPLQAVGEPGRKDRSLVPEFGAGGILLLLLAWWLFWRSF